ncbi:unnamed protein product [Fraxinus pennsylvanica]|uniref:DDE Tnp4 domain-containing protein n=1 Tax=Fraxinus pennsylvanica TaxID=56036 RepID=A0AAD1ZSM9_9LAMI|nr:unnamed protein product [Fraxinus pennsylvanica]
MDESGCLLVQALVDSEGRFLDVSAGWPGGKKLGDILKKSKLFTGIEDSKYLNGQPFEQNNGNSIPQYILGNSDCPLLSWLLTSFSEKNGELSSIELAFNKVHSRAMDLVGTAFANVKKRWKVVWKKWNRQCVEAFPFVIVSCCLLHNFLIKCSEVMPDENAELRRNIELPEFDGEDDEGGKKTCDALASHLS